MTIYKPSGAIHNLDGTPTYIMNKLLSRSIIIYFKYFDQNCEDRDLINMKMLLMFTGEYRSGLLIGYVILIGTLGSMTKVIK